MGVVMDYSIVMTTCASRADGEALATGIVRNKLANSVQITEVSCINAGIPSFDQRA